jgi:hypothetical protein
MLNVETYSRLSVDIRDDIVFVELLHYSLNF